MATHLNDEAINRAVSLIQEAQKSVVLTGAGSSTPSGIPDFRSADSGLWNRYQPMAVASLSAFRHNPEQFYDWLRPLANQMHQAAPNPAHHTLAKLEKSGHIQAIITQNFDGLHQRAGSQNVLEVHGALDKMTCIRCYREYPAESYIQPYLDHGKVPRCDDCQHVLKPDVVLFEEQLPARIWAEARQHAATCDLMIVAGSSLVVMPVAGLPMTALENSANIIVLNKTKTYIDENAAVVVIGDLAEILPAIEAKIIHE